MSRSVTTRTKSEGSTAAQALEAAGDSEQAADVAALDDAALNAQTRLGAGRASLVKRLIYGPRPDPTELASGTRIGSDPGPEGRAILDAAIECLRAGRAFTSDSKLSAELRATVAREKAYGFTVPSEFGGAGGSYGQLALVEEALAANGLGALAVEVSGELTIGAGSLLAYGSQEQSSTFLPMLCEGRLMAFGLTEVGVGVNAKKVSAYVERDERSDGWRLHADGPRAKLYITNATHGALVGLVARLGKDAQQIGLFLVELPEHDIERGPKSDFGFHCEPTGVSAFQANHNSRIRLDNFPIPSANQIQGDGVEVLFYCLRMGRCMLAAMSAGYQRMLAADAANFARQRDGVGGRVIKHELPRLNLGKILGGALQSRALSHLSLQQDAEGADLAGLRDLTKSAAAGTAIESQIACEHVLGGRSFHQGTRTSDARANLHVFGIVEGEDDLILMGMVKDLTADFTDRYMAGMLGVITSINRGHDEKILRIGLGALLRHPGRCALATMRLASTPSFWSLIGWIVTQAIAEVALLPARLIPTSIHPRYRSLPKLLRKPARFAERKLRGRRWTYLGINLWFQLELTRAQIPLQRLAKTIEHLTSMVALAWHASQQDVTQQRVAALQCELLRAKFQAIRILSDLGGMERTRELVALVGGDLERGNSSLVSDIEPEPFQAPWTGDSVKAS